MIDLNLVGKKVIENKKNKGFSLGNIEKEFCLLYGEVGEAYDAYRKNKEDLPSEFADVALYMLGICEYLNIDLEKAINEKLKINENRTYKEVNGVKIKVD